MKIRVSGIINESVVDGPGIRMVVFAQGCNRACPGCHNPETHAPDGGYETSVSGLLLAAQKNPLLRGLTFSGGEPFLQAPAFAELARLARASGLDIMTYTGYTIEEILGIGAKKTEVNATDSGAAGVRGALNGAAAEAASATDSGAANAPSASLCSGFLELLENTDILVDGPYIEALRTLNAPYRGSLNQRVIDVAATLALA